VQAAEYIRRVDDPRVLIISQRRLSPLASMCLLYEFEDLIADMDRVDIVAPAARPVNGRFARSLCRRIDCMPLGGALIPGAWRFDRKYDLVLATCQGLANVRALIPISRLRKFGAAVACYVEELWVKDVRARRIEVELLRHFDHVFLGYHGSVHAVADATGRPCRFLPPSVNTHVLRPPADPPDRGIDVHWMGRRERSLHERIAEWAARRGKFYLFDTRGNAEVTDPAEHRRLLASLLIRSRYFIVNRAKVNMIEHTGGQQELAFRYFEGAAAGAVLVGRTPEAAGFDELFGWTDSVIPVGDYDRSIAELLDALEADPERVRAVSRRNIAQSLRRHDGVYRWRDILNTLGLTPDKRVERRVAELTALADEIAPPDPVPAVPLDPGDSHPGGVATQGRATLA
jgi:hypothetical protein